MKEPRSGPAFVAVGGGKGGVGKSFVASSLAVCLARQGASLGRKVVAVDLDLGGSNLNLFLGEPYPERELSDFLDGRVDTLNAVSQPTRLDNLRYVAGSFDLVTAVDPLRDRKLDLVSALVGLDADHVILDLPAGSNAATLDFYFLGDAKIVVTNPEATAFHNAYGFMKNYVLRRFLTEFRDRPGLLEFVLAYYREDERSRDPGARTITALVETLREEFPAAREEVAAILEYDVPLILLNKVRKRGEREYLDRFRDVLESNLGMRCPGLGWIPEHRKVARAVRDAEPFVLAHPRHRITKRLERWAARVADRTAG